MLLRKETQQAGSGTGKLNDLLLRLLTPLKKKLMTQKDFNMRVVKMCKDSDLDDRMVAASGEF